MNKKSRILATPYILWMAIFIIVPLILIAFFAFTTEVTCDKEGNVVSEEEISATMELFEEEHADDEEEAEFDFDQPLGTLTQQLKDFFACCFSFGALISPSSSL